MTKKQKIAAFSSAASILLLFSSIGIERKIPINEGTLAVEDSIVATMEESMEEDASTKSETTLSSVQTSTGTKSETAQITTTSTTQAIAEAEEIQQATTVTEVQKTNVSKVAIQAVGTRATTQATTTRATTTTSSTSTTTIAEKQDAEDGTEIINDGSEYEPEGGWISLDDLTISLDMDVSKPCGLSKEDFVTLINKLKYDYKGYYKRNAELIWTLCQEYSMNEIFACGIIAQESGWAKVAGWGKNNYFGIAGGRYATEEEGLTAFIRLVGNAYLNENGKYYKGKTMHDVGLTYCDGDNWPKAVYGCMKLILKCR